ncbi:MAG TPA: hypothetical protein VFH31_17810 [Pyrinomonadaceae bacterium]|nr:hypothetical protein [Pyrinomonadaceae bacterium]
MTSEYTGNSKLARGVAPRVAPIARLLVVIDAVNDCVEDDDIPHYATSVGPARTSDVARPGEPPKAQGRAPMITGTSRIAVMPVAQPWRRAVGLN